MHPKNNRIGNVFMTSPNEPPIWPTMYTYYRVIFSSCNTVILLYPYFKRQYTNIINSIVPKLNLTPNSHRHHIFEANKWRHNAFDNMTTQALTLNNGVICLKFAMHNWFAFKSLKPLLNQISIYDYSVCAIGSWNIFAVVAGIGIY